MRHTFLFLGIPLAIVALVGFIQLQTLPFEYAPRFTVAFSSAQARYLGLQPQEVFDAVMHDLKPDHVRLQANWNEIEPEPENYRFDELDALIAAAKEGGATVTLAVGRKLPRWPECHDPEWLKSLRPNEVEPNHFRMVRQVIERYRDEPAIVRWQVENEPLFAYGTCPQPNWHKLRRELALVREMDPVRPLLLTDSGELSSWWETGALADEQGTTLYRTTWNPVFGYFRYPWFPTYYRLKAALIHPLVERTIVSELQMEPWAPSGAVGLSLEEAQHSFSHKQFLDTVGFFRRTGLPEAMLWGVEWWYHAKVNLGDDWYWRAGQQLFGV